MDFDKTAIPSADCGAHGEARRPRRRAKAEATASPAGDEREEPLHRRLVRGSWLLAAIFTGNVVYTAYHHDILIAVIGGALWPVAWAWMLITHGVNVTLLHESVAWFFR